MPYDSSKPYNVLTNNPNAEERDYDYGDIIRQKLADYPNIRGFLGLNDSKDQSGKVGEKVRAAADLVTDALPLAATGRALKAAKEIPDMSKLNIFGGAGAKEAPKEMIQRPGLKPMFEIDDSKSKLIAPLKPTSTQEEKYNAFGALPDSTLGQVLDHPELYKQYPHLKDTPVSLWQNYKGQVADSTTAPSGSWDGTKITASADSAEQFRRILLHEANHAVQKFEGFAKGGSPDSMITGKTALANIEQAELLKKQFPEGSKMREKLDIQIAHYNNLSKFPDTPIGRHQAYEKLQGELDSRNVEFRRNFSPEMRAEMTPQRSEELLQKHDNKKLFDSVKAKEIAKKTGRTDDEIRQYTDPPEAANIYLDQQSRPMYNPNINSLTNNPLL